MRSHAKAATAGSNLRQAKGLGRFFRGADAGRGASPDSKGSGAPSGRRGPLLTLIAVLALLALAAIPSVAGAAEFEFKKAFGPDGGSLSEFSQGCSVATDTEEEVLYVLDCGANALYKFDLEGNPVDFGGSNPDVSGNELPGLTISDLEGQQQLAVNSNSHVIYLTAGETGFGGTSIQAFHSNGDPALFTEGPNPGTNEIGGFSAVRGVAVDSSGNIYISGTPDEIGDNRDLSIYTSSGALLVEGILKFPTRAPENIAVDSKGSLYLLRARVTRYTPSEYPVTASTTYKEDPEAFDPNETRSIAVDPLTDELYALETFEGRVAAFAPSGALEGTFGGPGEDGELHAPEGIAVEAGGQERVFVPERPASGLRQVKIFKRIESAPSIESTSVSDVSADSATLRARINPRKAASTYVFEYGLEDCAISVCASVPLGGAGIGSGHKLVGVAQEIFGLEAGTTYHYRVLATNSFNTTEGPDRTFTTQVSGLGFQLADNRAWEMVSPAKKFAGKIRPADFAQLQYAQVQAAADGNGLVYSSIGPLDQRPEGNRAFEQSSVNLSRRGAEGWRSKDITPPHTEVTIIGYGSEHKLFTPDLGKSVVEPRDATPLSPQASERTLYLRENTEPATYTPLVTGKEGFANVPPGTVFAKGWGNTNPPLEAMGANSALTHVVFVSHQAGLSPGAPPGSIYMWSGGQLQLIDVLPASEGGGIPPVAELGSGLGSVRHAVSEDGSRVFWSGGAYETTGPGEVTALYARDTETEETVRLDLAKPGASEAGGAHPAFQGASADGSVVFFTDSQQLTADATGGRDLYRCVVSFEATPGCASLTDISAPAVLPGESAQVKDMSPAISDDGTHVYFVAEGVLDSAPNTNGDSAAAGEPNLYLWREGEGVRFIATRAEGDDSNWVIAAEITASASPNGRYFSFSSERSLTGYDNRDAIGEVPVQELFRYDALTDRLECVSCNPSGARPDGEKRSSELLTLADPLGLLRGQWVAATLPQATRKSGPFGVVANSFYRRRGVLDNGRIFFNSIDALVPADSNGQWDVYEYEPTGAGDCTASSSSASLVRSAGGCVSLVSSGTGEEEAAFVDASVSGDDAFFVTPAQLSVTDEDGELDIYDARVDGVPARLTPSTECLGEACQPPASAPNDPTPASAGFKGKGNLKPNARKRCAKGKRAVRRGGKARCVTRNQRQQKSKAKRAGKSGRAGR